MADTIKDYLVGIGFKVDDSGAKRAESSIGNIDDLIRALYDAIQQGVDQLKSFFGEMNKGAASADKAAASAQNVTVAVNNLANSGDKATTSMAQGARSAEELSRSTDATGKSADKAAEGLSKANKEAHLNNARKGSMNIKQLEGHLRKATGTLKKFINMAATYLIGSSIKSAVSQVIKFNEGLAESAKKLRKSIEDTRAYNVALQAMGKTADEIKKNKTLQALFDDLQAIGKQMALPEAAQGVKAIDDIRNELMRLRVVGTYAMQWIYYKIQTVAEGPLKDIQRMLRQVREWFSGNIEKVAGGIAKAFREVSHVFVSVIQFVQRILGWINKLPPGVKLVGAAILAVIAMIKSKTVLVTAIVALIILLIDDFMTYLEGGQSLFEDFWGWAVDAFDKVSTAISDAIKKVKEFWDESKNDDGSINWLSFGIKIAGWLLEGAKSVLRGASSAIKGWITGDKDATWPEVGTAIWEGIKEKLKDISATIKGWIVGDDTASWGEVGDKILGGIREKLQTVSLSIRSWITGNNGAEGGEPTWGDVGEAIHRGLVEKLQNISSKIKEWVAGDKNATWGEVGAAIRRGIKSKLENIWKTIRRWISGNNGDDEWTEAGTAIENGITSELSDIGATIKGLITGDQTASWKDVGETIRTGIKTGLANIGAFIKGLITGDPEASWSDVGRTILNGITNGLQSLGRVIKTLITGDSTASWGDVGTTILSGIKEKLQNLGMTIKKWITGDKNASWSDVGQTIADGIGQKKEEILEKLKSALGLGDDATFPDVGAAIVGKIADGAESILNALVSALTPGTEDDSSSVGTSIWDWISTAIQNAAKNKADFWGGVIEDGINRGGVIGSLESALGTAMLYASQIKFNIVAAATKIMQSGKPGEIWESVKGIVESILSIVNNIVAALTGEAPSDAEDFGQLLQDTIVGAVQLISDALKAAEGALAWVADIVSKAQEMGVLDEALKGIAATLIAIKVGGAVKSVVNLFKGFSSGITILKSLNPEFLAISGAIMAVVGVATILKRVWDRLMGGFSEKEIAAQGVEELGRMLDNVSDQLDEAGENAELLQDIFKEIRRDQFEFDFDPSQGESEYYTSLADYRKKNMDPSVYSEEVRALLESYNDEQWLALYKMFKEETDQDKVLAFLEAEAAKLAAEKELAEQAQMEESGNNIYSQQAEKAAAAAGEMTEEVAAATAALEGLGEETEGAGKTFEEASAEAADFVEGVRESTRTVLDTSTTSEEALEAVKVASEEAAQAILDAFLNLGQPIGPVFDSIVVMSTNMVGSAKTQFQRLSREAKSQFAQVISAAKRMRDSVVGAIRKMRDDVTDAFRTMVKNIDDEMQKATTKVEAQVNRIIAALNRLRTSFTVSVTPQQAFGFGGVVSTETRAVVGEEGKEYIIPVKHRERAISLLQNAAADLGISAESLRSASGMIGGAEFNRTPYYAASGSVTNNRSVSSTNTVNAPATINVYGTDPVSIARNVSRNQERLVLRNMKSIFAWCMRNTFVMHMDCTCIAFA